MNSKEDWERFAAGLARALGAVHLAVGANVVLSNRLPMIVTIALGVGTFYLTGLLKSRLLPRPAAALSYAGPVLLVLLVQVAATNPVDTDKAQALLLSFVVAVWSSTPVPAYSLSLFFGLAVAKGGTLPNPFTPPWR